MLEFNILYFAEDDVKTGVEVSAYLDGSFVGSYRIKKLFGCSGICVFHSFKIVPIFQGKGYGSQMLQHALNQAIDLKYSRVICTIVEGNKPMEVLMAKNGFDKIDVFTNPKTSNIVNVFMLKLSEPKPQDVELDTITATLMVFLAIIIYIIILSNHTQL